MKKRSLMMIAGSLAAMSMLVGCFGLPGLNDLTKVEEEEPEVVEAAVPEKEEEVEVAVEEDVEEGAKEEAVVEEEEKEEEKETASKDKDTIQSFYERTFGEDYWQMTEDQVKQQYESQMDDITIECEGNLLIYTYYMKDNLGDQQEYFENALSSTSDSLIDTIKKPAGVTEKVTIEFKYINKDGSVAGDVFIEG